MGDYYLSDDLETRIRSKAPECCQQCIHLLARRSVFTTEGEVLECVRAGDNQTAFVLGKLLIRFAESGRCDLREQFAEPD